MKITDEALVKVGHWLTFRSKYNGKVTRKFYRIEVINDLNYCCLTYPRTKNLKDAKAYDTIIDDLFKNPDGDEVFETLEDCQKAYPEYFL